MIAKPEPRAKTKARIRRLAHKHRSTVMQAVDLRDEGQCRICQCQTLAFHLPRQPHHHHIIYRSQGGLDTPENIILVCALCHDKVHRSGKLRVSGEASALTIERFIDGEWVMDHD